MTRTHAFASVAMLALVGSAASAAINPWDFNVFSRSTIGTAGSPYGSDYQGAAGSVGNAFFNGFSLRDIASSSPSLAQSFYGGGTFTLGGAVNGRPWPSTSSPVSPPGARSSGSTKPSFGSLNRFVIVVSLPPRSSACIRCADCSAPGGRKEVPS